MNYEDDESPVEFERWGQNDAYDGVGIYIEEIQRTSFTFTIELNTPAALELVLMCHLGPRTRKIEI